MTLPAQRYFEDYQLGERFASPSRTVTESHYLRFAALTGDNHPLHYDLAYCRARGLPERLAHGLLLASLTAFGASAAAAASHEGMVAFLEQSARFLKPVYIGDTLTPAFEVTGLTPQRTTGLLTLATRVTNQRGETVLEGSHTYLLRRRPAAP